MRSTEQGHINRQVEADDLEAVTARVVVDVAHAADPASVDETAAVLPEGTVTLLLADLESSTELWQSDSPTALAAQSELDVLVAESVAANDGVLPMVQGEGDSFVAAFTRASQAIACALDIQQRTTDAPLRFRMGVHTGEVMVHEDRYAGTTIIRAARVRNLGHGGQILVTSTTRDLVLDALPPGAELLDLGEHALKGLDRCERVHQLTHAGLQLTFPPLRSRSGRTALPARLTTFVGRDAEMVDVIALVASQRLVTLTGAGGCGKTRLAVEVAARLDADVWFCDLAPVADPELVGPTLCATVGAHTDVTSPPIAAACDHLSSSDGIVVLDNCEHLIDECASIADALLRTCPRLRILATSREPLGVVGEVPWRVPSLPAPRVGEVAPLDELGTYASVALFVDRAATVRSGFSLDEQNARPIAAICARLDGIPLAIELAAARVRVLSPREISDGLNDRFRLLGRGARTLLPRQQTLEASVAWSHDLLTDDQRAVLRRSSIFAGGFTLDAAEQITTGDGVEPSDVLELLAQLVDRSLVVADEAPGGVRYRMLETIRLYARERLVDAGEANDVAHRHLRWFEAFVRRSLRGASADGSDPVYDRLDDDYDNVRAAAEWAVDAGEATAGIRLVAPMPIFLGIRTDMTRFDEVSSWLQRLLVHDDIDDRTRAEGLVGLATAASMVNDWATMLPAADEAVALTSDGTMPFLRTRALWQQGCGLMPRDPDRSVAVLQDALALSLEVGDEAGVRLAAGHLCQVVSMWLGDPSRGLDIARNLPDGPSRDFYIGLNLLLTAELDEASRHLRAAAAQFQSVGNSYWAAVSVSELAAVAAARGDFDEAERLAHASMASANGAHGPTFRALGLLVELASRQGDPAAARSILGVLADNNAEFFVVEGLPQRFMAQAHAAIQCREALRGGDLATTRAAFEALEQEPRSLMLAGSYRPLSALVARSVGEIEHAEALMAEELTSLTQTKAYLLVPDALDIRAVLHADVGADEDAVRLFAAAAAARAERDIVGSYVDDLDFEAVRGEVRGRLGDEAFERAWSAGSALTLDEAIGLSLRGRGPRQRPQTGWNAITPTEQQVIDLVVEGLTNPQIAERMFISKRTVSTHLSHVFAKVGVSTRAELAAAATRRSA